MYDQAQEFIYRSSYDLYVLRLNLPTGWHVAVLGTSPPAAAAQQVDRLLASGEPATLQDDILTMLFERRTRAAKIAPWVEGHYRLGKHFRRRKR